MKIIYTKEEVNEATLKYFKGDSLATDVWIDKYCLKNKNGEHIENSPHDMFNRIVDELYRIETNYDNPIPIKKIHELIDDFKYLIPGGSIMAGIGNIDITSLSNCFVIAPSLDSYGGIFKTDQEQVQLMKRRGGVGHDLSNLRPMNMSVNNSAMTSTGVVSFMNRFSNSTQEVAQGGRRGALLLSISIKHVDADKFIDAKIDITKINSANISVKIDDDFMNAVINDNDYIQSFPIDIDINFDSGIKEEDLEYDVLTKGALGYYKKIKAKKLWNKLIHNNWKSAEPGILFWDTVRNNSLADIYPEYQSVTTNPCIPKWAKLMTLDGIKELKDVNIGDIIWSANGWTTIINKQNSGIQDIYEYDLEKDFKFFGTQGHQIIENGKKIKVKDAKFIDCFLNNIKDDFASFTAPLSIEPLNIQSSKYFSTEEVFDITVDNESHTFWNNGCNIANCGEINLCSYGSCILASLNLYSYVKNPFTKTAIFNSKLFKEHVHHAQKIMDDIIDLEIEKLDKILDKIKNDIEDWNIKQNEYDLWMKIKEKTINSRRTGLGVTAEGDMLAALNLIYGTQKATTFSEKIHKILYKYSHMSSIDMANDRGAFNIYDFDLEKGNKNSIKLMKLLPDIYKSRLEKFGRRNIANTTIAPAGSISILAQTTSGIESAFKIYYNRKRKVDISSRNTTTDENGNNWEEYNVIHNKFIHWYSITNNILFKEAKLYLETISNNEFDIIIKKSPYHNATSENINWIEKVNLQGTVQKWIDHSISATTCIPENSDEKLVNDIYIKAWKSGCKGHTIYRDNSRAGIMTNRKKKNGRIVPHRPKKVDHDIHHTVAKGKNWVVLIGLVKDPSDGLIKPYEVFAFRKKLVSLSPSITKGIMNKIKSKHYNLELKDITLEDVTSLFEQDENQALCRQISLSLRHKIPLEFIVDQLNEAEGTIISFSKAIARTLKKYIDNSELLPSKECPECKTPNSLEYSGGCFICKECGFSQCG